MKGRNFDRSFSKGDTSVALERVRRQRHLRRLTLFLHAVPKKVDSTPVVRQLAKESVKISPERAEG